MAARPWKLPKLAGDELAVVCAWRLCVVQGACADHEWLGGRFRRHGARAKTAGAATNHRSKLGLK